MTSPMQERLLLIFCASFNLAPSAPDLLTLSDPAKSTRLSFPLVTVFVVLLIPKIEIIRRAWDLELRSFMLVVAVALFLRPEAKTLKNEERNY